jgi:pimeloyl-ACP methyl ester carboxylesterase
MRSIFPLVLSLLALSAHAEESLIQLDTRPDVKVPVFYMKSDQALASVVLLPGGGGSIGAMVDGKPSGPNFLVRSRDQFAAAGFNVAVMSRASDRSDLDYPERISADHVQDIKALVDFLKKDTGLPVWLVGTSRGTVSATAAAIAFGNDNLAGIVLTSSVVSYKKTGAVPTQALDKIRIPVLVLHHERDACKVCAPYEVPAILKGLKNSPVKKLVMVSGGDNPSGDPCEPMHFHGYIGIEKPTVDTIAAWIRNPAP